MIRAKILKAIGRPASVLDLGCGDQWYRSSIPNAEYFAIDAWEPCKPSLVVDLENGLPPSLPHFDTVLMIDVIEHLTRPAGESLLAQAKGIGDRVVMFTPLVWSDNKHNMKGLHAGNKFNEHLSLWTLDDFKDFERVPTGSASFLGVWSR